MTVSRRIARPLLASTFLVGSVAALRDTPRAAVQARPVVDKVVPLAQKAGIPLPEDPVTLVRLNAGVQIGAALMLATGRAPRLSAAVLAAALVPTTAAGHRFWEANDPKARDDHRQQFFKNLALAGGLVIAAGDTEGKPGVAWRARHAARAARREARHLGKAARQEARLAKAKVG